MKKEEQSKYDGTTGGLSTQAKGNIVEDRIKELILFHGKGLLNVYKPVIDSEGIDLIVVRKGQFHPLFLQVKGRFSLRRGTHLFINIKKRTFTPHTNFYIVGAFFDDETLTIGENILLIPSEILPSNLKPVMSKNGEVYRVRAPITGNSPGRWKKYLIRKNELASKLIDKFENL